MIRTNSQSPNTQEEILAEMQNENLINDSNIDKPSLSGNTTQSASLYSKILGWLEVNILLYFSLYIIDFSAIWACILGVILILISINCIRLAYKGVKEKTNLFTNIMCIIINVLIIYRGIQLIVMMSEWL